EAHLDAFGIVVAQLLGADLTDLVARQEPAELHVHDGLGLAVRVDGKKRRGRGGTGSLYERTSIELTHGISPHHRDVGRGSINDRPLKVIRSHCEGRSMGDRRAFGHGGPGRGTGSLSSRQRLRTPNRYVTFAQERRERETMSEADVATISRRTLLNLIG